MVDDRNLSLNHFASKIGTFHTTEKILFSDLHRCVIISETKQDSKLFVFRRALGKASWMVEIRVYFTNIMESLLLDY